MTDYTIRSAGEEDLEELLRYATALFSEDLPGIFRRPIPTREEELEFIRSHTTRPNSVLLLAVAGGEVVGVAGFLSETLPERAHAGEFGISVAHSWRGRGIGRALLEALFTWASDHGIRRIEGEAFATNPRALELYRRLGFVEEGRLVGAVIRDGVPIDLIAIVKTLEPRDRSGDSWDF